MEREYDATVFSPEVTPRVSGDHRLLNPSLPSPPPSSLRRDSQNYNNDADYDSNNNTVPPHTFSHTGASAVPMKPPPMPHSSTPSTFQISKDVGPSDGLNVQVGVRLFFSLIGCLQDTLYSRIKNNDSVSRDEAAATTATSSATTPPFSLDRERSNECLCCEGGS